MKLLGEFKDQYQNTAFKIYESRAECRKGQFRLHRHTLFEIALIKEGKGIYVTQHGSETIAPGDIFLFSANEYHCITDIYPDDGKDYMTIINIQFLPSFIMQDEQPDGEEFMDIFLNRTRDFRNKLDVSNEKIDFVRQAFATIRRECDDDQPCCRTAVKSILLQMLICVYRSFNLTNRQRVFSALHLREITKAVGYINRHFCEDIRLNDILDVSGLSKSTFMVAFKNSFNMTPWDYIAIKRIEKATRLLRDSDETVLSVAIACGYNNTAGFNRIFKKITGLTPRGYRTGK